MVLIQWIIDWFKNSTTDGWLSFWGSILGFLGVILTIIFTKKQFKIERDNNIKPFILLRENKYLQMESFNYMLEFESKIMWNANVILNFNDSINLANTEGTLGLKCQELNFSVLNLGSGHAIDCQLSIKDNINIYKAFNGKEYIGSLLKGDREHLRINLYYYNIDQYMPKKRIYTIKEKVEFQRLESNLRKLSEMDVPIEFVYDDVFGNKYIKKIHLIIYIEFDKKQTGSIGKGIEEISINGMKLGFELDKEKDSEKKIKSYK